MEEMVQNMTKVAKLAGQLIISDATGEVANKLHPLTSMFYHYLARWGSHATPNHSAPLTDL